MQDDGASNLMYASRGDLDEEIRQQNQAIAEMRASSPDVDESIRRLENNLRLSDEENQRLVKEIEKFLRTRRD